MLIRSSLFLWTVILVHISESHAMPEADHVLCQHVDVSHCNNSTFMEHCKFLCKSSMKECESTCNDPSKGCLRPDVIPCDDECGTTFSDNVVGGEISARGAWPWLAAIGRIIEEVFNPFCSGTLITKQHVITAAHCFSTRINFIVIVRLGEYDTNVRNDGAIDFQILDMRGGDYNQDTKENDIILLKLNRPLIAYTDIIRPACLPYHLSNENFEGSKPVVVGWNMFDLENVPVPLQAAVQVVPIAECQKQYRNSGSVFDTSHICAGTGIQDSCKSGSGDPLNYLDIQRSRFYVIGLASFGPTNCGSHHLPGVYLRIGHYLDWINQNIIFLL